MEALHQLLKGLIDYAGLFPPAALPMTDAVREYAAYRRSDHAWVLGRFVLPTARLEEFETAAGRLAAPLSSQDPWPLSVLVGADPANAAAIEPFHVRQPGARITAVEARGENREQIAAILAAVPTGIEIFFEIDHRHGTEDRMQDLAEARRQDGRVRAKIRTGGITEDAFPATAEVARFLRAAVQAAVPLKATAGLHHPLRGRYPLTYEENSPRGTMFGFLNVFLAAALAHVLPLPELEALLEEDSAGAFQITDGAVTWRGHRMEAGALEVARRRVALSYGSCSFTEPIEDLQELGLL
jgi:hypothetical protein